MEPIELVIFDCDGVLVDSEVIANRILAQFLTEIGLPTTYEQSIQRYMGRSFASCREAIEKSIGRPVTNADLDVIQAKTFAAFRQQLQPVAGIEVLIRQLPVASCVASSGSHEKMAVTLGVTGLAPFFQNRIFSSTQVARGKPYPDLFLYAAEQMRVDPARCVVVEDSVPGVEAATAAKMRVFGYSAMTEAYRLQAAGAVTFDSMSSLKCLLQDLY